MPSTLTDERPVPDDRPYYRMPFDKPAPKPRKISCCGALVESGDKLTCTKCGRSYNRG